MQTNSTLQTIVCVTCNDGTTWTTKINGTPDTANAYFLNKEFTDECPETGRETVRRVYQVEILSADL
jgi:hypothetical protein